MKKTELEGYKESSKLLRKMADCLDEVVHLNEQEPTKETEDKEEEIMTRYLLAALKLQKLGESI